MKKHILISTIITIFTFYSCSEEDFGYNNQNDNEFTFNGYIQKGPFITGTSVVVNELNNSLNSTGKTFSSQITNDFGNFEITFESDQQFAEFIADGYYFNEVEGDLSDGKLSLRAISKMSQSTNINILTTLQADRVKYLIQEGSDYDDALSQSKSEVLRLFKIDEDAANFSNMNITEQGTSNSILLAISSILQSGRGVAEMSELISKLSLDIADNGVIDNTALTDKIIESSQQVNVTNVIKNLEERYSELGESVTIDNFYDFIDSDGDGVLNGSSPYLFLDKDSYTFGYEGSQQAISFFSNYTPTIDIINYDDTFASVVSVTGKEVVLELAENTGRTSRYAELQFFSTQGELINTIAIEQASSYSELCFNLHFGVTSRATLPDSDIEVDNITMIAFDAEGILLFNITDDMPEIDNGLYRLQFNPVESHYDACTIYTVINGVYDYSLIDNISEAELLKSDISDNEVLSSKDEGVYLSIGQNSTIEISLQYAGISNVVLQVDYDDTIAASDRAMSSLQLIGNIFTSAYLFKESTENLEQSASADVNTQSLSRIVGGGSTISAIQVTLKNGNQYILSLSSDIILQSGNMYSFNLIVGNDSLTNESTTINDMETNNDDSSLSFSSSTSTTR